MFDEDDIFRPPSFDKQIQQYSYHKTYLNTIHMYAKLTLFQNSGININ